MPSSLSLRPCHGQRLARRVTSLFNVGVGVRNRQEVGFELRRGQQHAAAQHLVEEPGEARRVAPLRPRPVHHLVCGEEEGPHRADAREPARVPAAGQVDTQAGLQPSAQTLERLVEPGRRLDLTQRCEPGSHRQRATRQRACLIHQPVGRGGTTPMLPTTGSTITAAIASGCSPNHRATPSRSLNAAVRVSRAVPSVTPALSGTPNVAAPDSALIRNESPWP